MLQVLVYFYCSCLLTLFTGFLVVEWMVAEVLVRMRNLVLKASAASIHSEASSIHGHRYSGVWVHDFNISSI